MALIKINNPAGSQMTYGRHKPHADMKKHGVVWAAVEGPNDGLYPSVRECVEGLNVGDDGSYKIGYEEYKDSKTGKPHDITIGKYKLREMICDIADIEAKHKYEGALSRQKIQSTEELEKAKAEERGSAQIFESKTSNDTVSVT